MLPSACHATTPKELYFLQVMPIQSDTCILSTQMAVMQKAFNIALSEFKIRYGDFNVQVIQDLQIPDEEQLYRTVKAISSTHAADKVVVGITRSTFARVAAKAALGTSLIGISSAAFSDELRKINHNFISVSSPWQRQWGVSIKKLLQLECIDNNTLGVFNSKDILSRSYEKGFKDAGFTNTIDSDDLVDPKKHIELNRYSCIYMGTLLPGSISPLSAIYKNQWAGTVVGMGDWTFYTPEMKELLKRMPNRKFRIFAPIVWQSTENDRTKVWLKKNFGKNANTVEPLTMGVYESATLALNYLYFGADVLAYDRKKWNNFGLLRDYEGMAESGNLLSKVDLVEIK